MIPGREQCVEKPDYQWPVGSVLHVEGRARAGMNAIATIPNSICQEKPFMGSSFIARSSSPAASADAARLRDERHRLHRSSPARHETSRDLTFMLLHGRFTSV